MTYEMLIAYTRIENKVIRVDKINELKYICKIEFNFNNVDTLLWCEENCKFKWAEWYEYNKNDYKKFIGFESLEEKMLFVLSNNY